LYFSFRLHIVCFSIYGLWLPLWYLQTLLTPVLWKLNKYINNVGLVYCVLCHFQQYLRYIVGVSLIGGGNRGSGENHQPVASVWQTRSHNVVPSTTVTKTTANFTEKYKIKVVNFKDVLPRVHAILIFKFYYCRYSLRNHLFCTCYKWNDSRIIIFHLLLSDYYDKRKRLCPSRRMDIMQLWTFIEVNIRIYRSNIYDIYRGQSRGKYHETVINVL
jgi:hypothetical protein